MRGHTATTVLSPPVPLTETLDSLSANQTTDAGNLQFPIGINVTRHFTAQYDGVLPHQILARSAESFLLARRRKPPPQPRPLRVFLNSHELVKARSMLMDKLAPICWTSCLFLTVNKTRGKPNNQRTIISTNNVGASKKA